MITQREIVAAYHEGRDVSLIIRRRVRMLQGLAIVATAIGIAVCLYIIKSAIGIDLFAFHLKDILT